MSVEFLSVAEQRIAYQRQVSDSGKPGVIFLSGYASDMTGAKAGTLADFCTAHDLPYIRFDYSGCGQSPGVFTDGTIGQWLRDSLAVFDQLTSGTQIIVGSSMGGWLGLHLAKLRSKRVKALIGVAAAPDFTEKLVWEKLTNTQREILICAGQIGDNGHAPMTLKLIEEARSHLLLDAPIDISCHVRLLQGMKDTEVPWNYAPRIAEKITHDDVRVTLIKNGDHRLSTPDDLAMLEQMIAEFI